MELAVLWGKIRTPTGGPISAHPLICHMLDVGLVAGELFRDVLPGAAKAAIAKMLRVDETAAERWISFIAALHDLGKASPAFQLHRSLSSANRAVMSRLLEQVGLPCPKEPRFFHHGIITALELPLILEGNHGIAFRQAQRLASMVGGHHGVFPTSAEINDCRDRKEVLGGKAWAQARTQIAATLAELFHAPLIGDIELDNANAMALAGLVSVADWIGSVDRFFGYTIDNLSAPIAVGLDEYARKSRDSSKHALKELGWSGWNPDLHERSFVDLFTSVGQAGTGIVPNPLQEAVIELGERVREPMLVIAEAPMGEGKTEAAMFLADRFGARLSQRGCYFALPTQATSNQMFSRVHNFLQGRYTDQMVNFQLLHGHAALNAEFQTLLRGGDLHPQCTFGDHDEGDDRSGVIAAQWFTYRKRGLLAPFGVGTIDQALLAVLQTRHVFVRLFGLSHKTVIIDEVHAYDAYMTTLLERLLEWLAAVGSSVVMLSATLPKARRDALAAAYLKGLGADLAPPDERYPRLTWVGLADAGSRHVETSERSSRELSLRWVDGEVPQDGTAFTLGERLRSLLGNGGCAAVVCNTVRRAQEVYSALKAYFPGNADDGGPVLDLLHARFLFKDRDAREKRVLLRFGKPGAKVEIGDQQLRQVRRPDRAVLVATQVIEQSLDLDFDLMVTDHAPVDLMLQRVGRLHRHQRPSRPAALATPQLWLCAPGQSTDGLPEFGRANTAVYDEHILLRSWLQLRNRDKVAIPTEVEDLIESVYDEKKACPENLGGTLRSYWDKTAEALAQKREEYEGKARQIRIASTGAEDIIEDFNRELDEDDPTIHPTLQALTRLSGATVRLVLLRPGQEQLEHGAIDHVRVREILEHSITVSHPGAVRVLLGGDEQTPRSWRSNALLRHHRLLRIGVTGKAHLERYIVQLSSELGLRIIDQRKDISDADV